MQVKKAPLLAAVGSRQPPHRARWRPGATFIRPPTINDHTPRRHVELWTSSPMRCDFRPSRIARIRVGSAPFWRSAGRAGGAGCFAPACRPSL